MQSSTSTSIHEMHPFNAVHRRRSSYCVDVYDSSPAGRPLSFVPKRKSGNESPVTQTLSEDGSASPVPLQGQIRLVEETAAEDSPTPQNMPRNFCTFPRMKPELSRGRAPQFDNELLTFTPSPDTPLEPDVAEISSDQLDALSLADMPAVVPDRSEFAVLPRKKSGELVKPSLKSTGFATWSASSTARARTKSAPTTPMGSKSVHFDAHLEHVRLFLAEQKPLAISRDGSPTETSEGDTTDTNFPFSRMTDVTLRIIPIALPEPPPEPWTFDVRLETLSLKDTALVGTVLVRNVAFVKWVAVRFTLDAWQTTSEVTARHITSLRDNTFDRFEFRVRLVDYMNGIESKRLILCVRFSVEGRQMWDSNGGRNYEMGFEKVKEDPGRRIHASSLSGAGNSSALVTDLRKRLEKVVQKVPRGGSLAAAITNRRKTHGLRVWLGDHAFGGDDDDDDPSPQFRPHSRSPSPLDDQKKAPSTPSLSNKDIPLSARYDFGASLRSPNWTPPQVHSPTAFRMPTRPKITQRRTRSPPPPVSPLTTIQFPRAGQHRRSLTIPLDSSPTNSPRESWPQGSPRDSADSMDGGTTERCRREDNDACDEDKPRRHSRGWVRGSSYEQIIPDTVSLKMTPPGIPTVTPPTPPGRGSKFHLNGEGSSGSSSCSPSVSPSTTHKPLDSVWGALSRNDDDNFPSSPSLSTLSSTPTSVSPLSPRADLPRAASDDRFVTTSTPGRNGDQRPPINSTPYYSFLDQFCFFTGVTTYHPHLNNNQNDNSPRRVQSASTVEDYFSRTPPHNDDVQSPLSIGVSPSDPTNLMHSPIAPDVSLSHGLMTS